MRYLSCVLALPLALSGCLSQMGDPGSAQSTQLAGSAGPANGAAAATADMGTTTTTPAPAGPDMAVAKVHYRDAEVDLDPIGNSTVNGEVLFLGPNGAVTMSLLAGGFAPAATYTVEIHQNGDCRNQAKNIGPLWTAGAALANLGAPTVDAQGVGTLVKTAAWTIADKGAADIIDRSLVVVDAKGAVVACGVIWR